MAQTERTQAVAYYRTSSAANVEGDSQARQRAAVMAYAGSQGIEVVAEFYDAAVSGADPVNERPGFQAMMARIAGNGVRVVLVEDASRFARDLMVQLVGHDFLKKQGIELVPVNAPDHFRDETPTAKMVRQILGAVAEFDKTQTVAKLKGARDRKSATLGRRVEGRHRTHSAPELLREARRLNRASPKTGKRRSLREIGLELAALGYTTGNGTPFRSEQVDRLLNPKD